MRNARFFGTDTKQSRLVCALCFRRAGGCLRERSSTNVSRHENDSYGAQGYAVVWSALTPNEVRSFHHAQIPAGQRAGNHHQGRHRVPTSIAAAKLQVLRYLGRYTHRVAISNHRLLAFEQDRVTFRWKNYARGGKQGQMTLVATEFLRRFFLHVLPKRLVRIRHFGFLVNRSRASSLVRCRQLLASNSSAPAETGTCQVPSESSTLWHCPRCGAAMIVIQRFTTAELSTCAYFDSS
jgi:Putative transposase